MNKRMLTLLLGIFFVFGASAVAQVKDEDKRLNVQQNCPVSLATAKVELRDTTNGIAVVFTAEPAEVAELRRRVELLARTRRAPSEEPVDIERLPAGAIKFESVTDGARLILTPMDPKRLAVFRSRVHALVEKMREGDCAIMPETGPGALGFGAITSVWP